MTSQTAIYQTQQIREFERLAQEQFHLSPDTLMQRAGKAAFDYLKFRWPDAQHIAVFCGAGNNGGDGYVLAHLAHTQGFQVTVWQIGDHTDLKSAAKAALSACEKANLEINPFRDTSDLNSPDVIVDAICGIGIKGALRPEIVSAIKKIQQIERPILSIDIPTGVDADTGNILGAAIQATATITFIGLKLGLLTGAGIAYTGNLASNDLQLPALLFERMPPVAEKIALAQFSDKLPPRMRDWHKGLSGHVLVIGGELGFSGAARMAAISALRVGAGLVSVATRPENAPLMNLTWPEIMCHGIQTASDLKSLIEKATVIIVGPGLGQTSWGQSLFEVAYQSGLPLVVDADGLNLLAQQPKVYDQWVLTPHPGEAARLINSSVKEVQANRLAAIHHIRERYHGVVVLKGAGSMILAQNELAAVCDQGNPGMATAGMGDILSGIIGGLIAQGLTQPIAAKLGVCLHAVAGDLAADEGERGMIATDLLPYIRWLANHLHGNKFE